MRKYEILLQYAVICDLQFNNNSLELMELDLSIRAQFQGLA